MSIRPDNWIRDACTVPKHVVTWRGQTFYTHQTMDEIRALNEGIPRDSKFYYQARPITEEERDNFVPMITPFVPGQERERVRPMTTDEKIRKLAGEPLPQLRVVGDENWMADRLISYGLTSFGYDVRLSNEFRIFTNINSTMIDPKNFDNNCLVEANGEYVIIPPNSYVLGRTVERFKIPKNVMVVCVGKSTYARCGAIVNVTPIEAGFEGTVVIEISNSTSLPLKVYAYEGIAQFLFFESATACDVSYADRGGKYQGQSGIQTAKV